MAPTVPTPRAFRLDHPPENPILLRMKSCLGIIIAFVIFVAVIGGGALLWYLSDTTEFSRKQTPASALSR
jgi:hypothetical protein